MTHKQLLGLMGHIVIVSKEYKRAKILRPVQNTIIRWDVVSVPLRAGYVTGIRYIKNGELVWVGDEEGYGFIATKTIKAIMVRWWPTEKEFPVPVDGITEVDVFSATLPQKIVNAFFYGTYPSNMGHSQRLRNTLRARLSADSKLWPRDAWGRFCK